MAGPNTPSTLRLYANARIIDPASGRDEMGGILCNGETIADIGPHLNNGKPRANSVLIDCKGQCLVPGLIDMRAYLGEPGEEHKETLETAGRSAVAGGITSIVCLPNTQPVIDDMSGVEFVARRARKLGLSKVYPYGAVSKNLEGREIAELGMLKEAGAVAFTDGFHTIADIQLMQRALSYASTFGLLIVQHPEEPGLAGSGVMNTGETATRLGLTGIPREAEIIIVERDIRLVEMTNGRLHFAHLSTADSIDAVRKAKARGLAITCDTSPPYFALNELAVGDYRTFAKLSPPLRMEFDRQAVIEGLKDGTIDAIASDHCPQDEESKRLPFSEAAAGGVGLETLLPITLELYHNGHLSLLQAFDLVTRRPADLLGLEGGRLEIGRPADFAVVDTERGWKVEDKTLRSKSKNSPFDGRPVQGRVLMTVIDGRVVFQAED
ncbi:MAG: dihydroorotase [Rhodospirillales bacterium]|nr:dihydroorotase [Rhodospirillales bacterium]